MLKTNREHLAKIAVQFGLDHPKIYGAGAEPMFDNDGRAQYVPSMAGITYNFNVGDTCMNIRGEHVEPGVSAKNEEVIEQRAAMAYSCIGNEAVVITGDAKGEKGYVAGKHGGSHVMLSCSDGTMEKLNYNDSFLVRSFGMGLTLLDYPDILCFGLDPDLLDRIPVREESGKLLVPVAARIPSHLMGSGRGYLTGVVSDYDIETTDREEYERLHLDALRFGDFVLLEDEDNTYGRTHRPGSVSIGLIIHSDSYLMGHGPGVSTLFSCRTGILEGYMDPNANLAQYMNDARYKAV